MQQETNRKLVGLAAAVTIYYLALMPKSLILGQYQEQ